MGDTPFIKFWDAINTTLHLQRLPELLFGEAHVLWHQTMSKAQAASMIEIERRIKRAA